MSMNNLGKPIPYDRRQRACDAAKDMGCTTEEAFHFIETMSNSLERDKPHEAIDGALKSRILDYTGVLVIMAYLLTDELPSKVTESIPDYVVSD